MSIQPRSSVIVGAGITGLTAAFYLQRAQRSHGQSQSVALIEAAECIGGKVRTLVHDGFILEQGPDSFLAAKPEALQLIEDLGLGGEVRRSRAGRSYILHRDRLCPIPSGAHLGVPTRLLPMLGSRLVAPRDKLRVARELLHPQEVPDEDQALGGFLRARYGASLVTRLAEPLLSAIYGASLDHYSAQAVLPQCRPHRVPGTAPTTGRHISRLPPGGGPFLTLATGLQSLVQALAAALTPGTLQLGSTLKAIEKQGRGYRLILADGQTLAAENVILAVPAESAARILPDGVRLFAPLLQVPPTSAAIVTIAFAEAPVRIDRPGTGFLVPRDTGYTIKACTWVHRKWPHAVPSGGTLLRCYIDYGDGDPNTVGEDAALVGAVRDDLRRILTIQMSPSFYHVWRWPHAMPQYAIGHRARLTELRRRLAADFPGLILAGASYAGIGLPDCIRQGKEAAAAIASRVLERAA